MRTRFTLASASNLRCRGWHQGLLRLLENLLAVGEDPDNLVVYAALGKAARDWPSHDKIVEALRTMAEDETLIVRSGKPIGKDARVQQGARHHCRVADDIADDRRSPAAGARRRSRHRRAAACGCRLCPGDGAGGKRGAGGTRKARSPGELAGAPAATKFLSPRQAVHDDRSRSPAKWS